MDSPVHLLCRALRMAPASYGRFELATAPENYPLELIGGGTVWVGDQRMPHNFKTVTLDSAARLGAAMQHCAAAESLSVHMSPDKRRVIVVRIGAGASSSSLSV